MANCCTAGRPLRARSRMRGKCCELAVTTFTSRHPKDVTTTHLSSQTCLVPPSQSDLFRKGTWPSSWLRFRVFADKHRKSRSTAPRPCGGDPLPTLTDGRGSSLTRTICKALSQKHFWSGQLDSNQRPAVPKTAALPGCAIPRSCWEMRRYTLRPLPASRSERAQRLLKSGCATRSPG